MGLNTSLYTSLSGLTANSQDIAVTGNNIVNANTPGFKSSLALLESQFSQLVRAATAPDGDSGGVNPSQVGLGVRVGSVTHIHSQGDLETTNLNTDLAIEGNGFFVLGFEDGQRYTRAGAFQLDRDFNLVDPNGGFVQGHGIDSSFNLVQGALTKIAVPVGSLTLAQATTSVNLQGLLSTDGVVALTGSTHDSAALFSDALGTTPATGATALNSLFDGAGTQLFQSGDLVTVTGVQKGNLTLQDHSFAVDTPVVGADATGSTLQEFADFLQDILGIDTTVGGGEGTSIGAGQLAVTGNTGSENGFTLDDSNFVVNGSAVPFGISRAAAADGESIRSSFVVFDSLGNPLKVDLAMVLEGKSNAGTAWRFYAQSSDDTDLDRVLGSGLLNFDNTGNIAPGTTVQLSMDRAATGAQTPLEFDLIFDTAGSSVQAGAGASSLAAPTQDGAPLGTLETFRIGEDGIITGVFTNSLDRPLARVLLAKFNNPAGLEESGSNLFRQTVNSGEAVFSSPSSAGAGRLVAGALELSNVELSQQFINLITASTGFSASSRVLTTSDRLLQELLSTVR